MSITADCTLDPFKLTQTGNKPPTLDHVNPVEDFNHNELNTQRQ